MHENRELCFIGIVEKVDEQEAKVCIVPEFCPGLKDVKDFYSYDNHLLDSLS